MGSLSPLYDRDFYAWAHEQVSLLRAGKLAEADLENIAEEIESMGKAEKRELVNRLAVLLAHLLKWQFQPERRGASGKATISLQRLDLVDHLSDNPSLKARVPEAITSAYRKAVIIALGETDLPMQTFSPACPWSFEQLMNADFWPENGSKS